MSKKIHEDVILLISLKKLIDNGLSADKYTFLYLLHIEERWKLSQYIEKCGGFSGQKKLDLINLGYIEKKNINNRSINLNNLQTTEVFKKILTGEEESENVENWINDWYNLWPVGVKTGGYYLKTDKKGSLHKMKRFLVKHPEYTREDIMQATKNYLNEQSIKGYTYTKLAPYFIEKENLSVLAGECEILKETTPDVEHNEEGYGQHEL